MSSLLRLDVFADHPGHMTRHAREAVDDGSVFLHRITDDGGPSLVDPLALRAHQQVRLQAVRQVENDLAAVMLESVFSLRAERMCEQILAAVVAAEVVALQPVLPMPVGDLL